MADDIRPAGPERSPAAADGRGAAAAFPLPESLARDLPGLRSRLLDWYRRRGRDLPWRRVRDPYRTWISEIMLQQTRVDRVVEVFGTFLERFPDVVRLAEAREADVLHAWEGMGYYRRARQLHAAARRVVSEHGGRIPDSFEALRALPGVGRYTASAIASIAFDRPLPVVEANSRRVLSRLVGYAAPVGGPAGDEPLWQIAEAVLPPRHAGAWNQALMDLGATVCTVQSPACASCPLGDRCIALATRRVGEIPVKASRRATRDLAETAIVVRRGPRVLVVRRGKGEWWEGLWDFPRLPSAALLSPLGCGRRRRVGTVEYTVTHHRVRVTVATCTATLPGPRRPDARWISWSALGTLAMTSPGRRIAAAAEPARPPARRRPPAG